MNELQAGVRYASGQEYRLAGEGIEWTGIRVEREPETEVLHLNFEGHIRNRSRTVSHAWVPMSPAEATAIAGALLSAAQGAAVISVRF